MIRNERALLTVAPWLSDSRCWQLRRQGRQVARDYAGLGHGPPSRAALIMAFYVDNGPHLPLWDRLPGLSFWFLPAAIGTPLIVRAMTRARRTRS